MDYYPHSLPKLDSKVQAILNCISSSSAYLEISKIPNVLILEHNKTYGINTLDYINYIKLSVLTGDLGIPDYILDYKYVSKKFMAKLMLTNTQACEAYKHWLDQPLGTSILSSYTLLSTMTLKQTGIVNKFNNTLQRLADRPYAKGVNTIKHMHELKLKLIVDLDANT